MTQTNIQQHSETVAVPHLGVAYQYLPGRLVMAVEVSNLVAPLRVSRVAGDPFQREIVMYHNVKSPFMTQTNIQQHSETPEAHHHGVT